MGKREHIWRPVAQITKNVKPRAKVFTGLEIGTSKVCVIQGEVRADEGIKLLGIGQSASRGVRKGEIVDFELAHTALSKAVEMAEKQSNLPVKEVYLGISGGHIQGENHDASISIPEVQQVVVNEDLEDLKEMARDIQLHSSRAFLHSIVRSYVVDGKQKVGNPIGVPARDLSAHYHLIHGVRNRVQNTIRCVRELPIEVDDIVFSPLAAAQVLLTRQHKDDGVLLIDVGGGTSDYVLYLDGAVSASGSIGIGGDHVTNDIHLVCRVPLQIAERIKTRQSSVYYDSRNVGQMVSVEPEGDYAGGMLDQTLLNQVVHMRVRETFELIRKNLEESKAFDSAAVKSGIFLTGGGSLLTGIHDLAKAVFGIPVHHGGGDVMSGNRTTAENPQFATAIGLIRYAQLIDERPTAKGAAPSIGARLGGWLGKAS